MCIRDRNKVEGAGIFDADQGAMAYSNSKGVFAYKANTKAAVSYTHLTLPTSDLV